MAILELTEWCQTTLDERRVADGYVVEGYDCPNCGNSVDDECFDDGDVYECCFVLCAGDRASWRRHEAHVFLYDDKCENCERCDEFCQCSKCDDCRNPVDSVCDNCYSCDDCCRCNYCYECDTKVTDWCGDCDKCNDCCSCQEDDCDCVAPHRRFTFPANGDGVIGQDERLIVELPAGTIDPEGLSLIVHTVRQSVWDNRVSYTTDDRYLDFEKIVAEVGPLWQARRGNFTRRLSSALHKHGIKLDAETISKVGNIARQHSSDSASWEIEFTRDLNMSAEDFYHEDSCWWDTFGGGRPASAYTSRCAVKNWGGLGIRSFVPGSRRNVSGRAWIQPLDQRLLPTHDAINARAYVVYNGYGDIDGYVAARLVAHLTGRSYKKIAFDAQGQYVNGTSSGTGSGYLIADEATTSVTETIYLNGDHHDKFDAYRVIEPVLITPLERTAA